MGKKLLLRVLKTFFIPQGLEACIFSRRPGNATRKPTPFCICDLVSCFDSELKWSLHVSRIHFYLKKQEKLQHVHVNMYTHEHIHIQDLFNKLWHDLVQETVLIEDVFVTLHRGHDILLLSFLLWRQKLSVNEWKSTPPFSKWLDCAYVSFSNNYKISCMSQMPVRCG